MALHLNELGRVIVFLPMELPYGAHSWNGRCWKDDIGKASHRYLVSACTRCRQPRFKYPSSLVCYRLEISQTYYK